MMTLLMGENPSIEHKMARRQSSTNLTDQQARAGKGLSRRPMPRRHTVSTPYQDGGGNASKIVKQDHTEPTTDARLRKLLRSKKHRSLGRLDMSNLDARAWMSPDTATPSPTSLCSPILPGHAAILDHERQAWVNQQQQQQQSRPHDYFEWDHGIHLFFVYLRRQLDANKDILHRRQISGTASGRWKCNSYDDCC